MLRPLTREEYDAREKAYGQMAELVRGIDSPTVVVVERGDEAHVHIHVPGTDDLARCKLAGQKAIFALSLYLGELDRLIAAAKTQDAQS